MVMPNNLLFELAERDPKIYFAFDLDRGKFIYSNRAFKSFFQEEPQALNPDFLFNCIHEDDKAYVKATFDDLQPGLFDEKIEFRFLFKDTLYYLSVNMLLMEFENHDRTLSGYVEDITGFKENVNTSLSLSNKKNAVLNILSHDLAGPLGSIQNYSYLLSRQTNPEDKLTLQIVNSIDAISKRCIKLIQEFIKMEFLETVGVDMVKARFNLVEIVGSFMDDYLQHQHSLKKNVNFKYESAQIYAEVDDTKLMQVINNLLSNALKFTPDGGEINVFLSKKESTVLMVVQDSGVGIPGKFQAELFEKFSSARRPGLKGEDSVGLGMYITKTIVEWHNGRIWFESEEGKGTTFFIEIPGCD